MFHSRAQTFNGSEILEENIDLGLTVIINNVSSSQSENGIFISSFYSYICMTDKCNSIQSLKSVLQASTFQFIFASVMFQLHNSSGIYHPFPYSNYSNGEQSAPIGIKCYPCRNLTLLPPTTQCIRAQAVTCGTYICGSCYRTDTDPYDNRLAILRHHEIYYLKNKTNAIDFQYSCDLPYCNSENKQEEIRSLYTIKFDFQVFEDAQHSQTTIITSTVTDTSGSSQYNSAEVVLQYGMGIVF
ncbi:unnamed protein product, partial [Rotaria sordida]